MTISDVTMKLNMDRYLHLALEEDITSEDVSANAVMDGPCRGEVDLMCKQDGVIAGLQVFARVFELLDDTFQVEFFCKDGDRVTCGQRLAVLRGDIRALLSGERTALNYLQRMSGIATHTAEMNALLEGSGITLLDTRKTTPNMRIFEKYAVTVGGGTNHRYNLSDGVMLKDNHIGAAGSIAKAVARAQRLRAFRPQDRSGNGNAGAGARSRGSRGGHHHAGQHGPRHHEAGRGADRRPGPDRVLRQCDGREDRRPARHRRGLYLFWRTDPLLAHSRLVAEAPASAAAGLIARRSAPSRRPPRPCRPDGRILNFFNAKGAFLWPVKIAAKKYYSC